MFCAGGTGMGWADMIKLEITTFTNAMEKERESS
jgi:hypothetical protein